MRSAKAALSKLKLSGGPIKIKTCGEHELGMRDGRRPCIVSEIERENEVILKGKPARLMIQNLASVRVKCVGTRSGAVEMVDNKGCVLEIPAQGTVICDRCEDCEIRLFEFNSESSGSFKIFHSLCEKLRICWFDKSMKQQVHMIPADKDSGVSNLKTGRSVTVISMEKRGIRFQTLKCDRHGVPIQEEEEEDSKEEEDMTNSTTTTTRPSTTPRLQRFLDAQNGKTEHVKFQSALAEFRRGRKVSCWIWYV